MILVVMTEGEYNRHPVSRSQGCYENTLIEQRTAPAPRTKNHLVSNINSSKGDTSHYVGVWPTASAQYMLPSTISYLFELHFNQSVVSGSLVGFNILWFNICEVATPTYMRQVGHRHCFWVFSGRPVENNDLSWQHGKFTCLLFEVL